MTSQTWTQVSTTLKIHFSKWRRLHRPAMKSQVRRNQRKWLNNTRKKEEDTSQNLPGKAPRTSKIPTPRSGTASSSMGKHFHFSTGERTMDKSRLYGPNIDVPMAKSVDYLRNKLRAPESNIPSPKARSTLTVSQAPRLHPSRVDKQEINKEDPFTMAQGVDVLKRGLRKSPNATSPKVKYKVTVAVAPRLHPPRVNKQEINKEDPFTMAQGMEVLKKGLRTNPDASESHKSPSLTVHQAPRLHHSHRERSDASKREDTVSMAQSIDILKKGLRNSPASLSERHANITIPSGPKFHLSHERALPKSQEELDRDLMLQIKPFKARSCPKFDELHAKVESPTLSKSVTEARPFQFHSDARAAYHKPLEPSANKEALKEALDLKECEKQFKARPMPEKFKRTDKEDGSAVSSKEKSASKGENKATQFRARPIPLSTYISPDKATDVSPAHSPSHNESMILTNDLEATLKEQDNQFSNTSRQHREGTSVVPTSQSKISIEEYKRQKEEKRRLEKEAEQKQFEFHARPLPKSIHRKSIPSEDNSEIEGKEDSGIAKSEPKEFDFRARPLSKSLLKARAKKEQHHSSSRGEVCHTKPIVTPSVATKIPPPVSEDSKSLTMSSLTDQFDRLEQMKARTVLPIAPVANTTLATRSMRVKPNGSTAERTHSPIPSVEMNTTTMPSAFDRVSIVVFLSVCAFRCFNALFMQSYFNPDEFWQTTEPAYCAVFSKGSRCPGLTWEWTRRAGGDEEANLLYQLVRKSMLGPVRSYLSVLPTYLLYLVAKLLNLDSAWMIRRGPAILNALLFAAPLDWSVWYTARWINHGDRKAMNHMLPGWCLFCSTVSWFNAYSLVRTYSNSQEACFMALALVLVSPELFGNQTSQSSFLKACLAFFMGGLSTAIRFTSCIAFVVIGIILATRRGHFLTYIIFPCALFGVLGISAAMLVDRYFYGFWTIPLLGNIHFNVIEGNAELYGTHPWHWYFTAGLPAVSGLLFPFVLKAFCGRAASYWQHTLSMIMLSYLSVLSFSGHKEFRFIQPILPLVCLLVGPQICSVVTGKQGSASLFRRRLVLSIFIVTNLAVTLYLGLVHQTAPISVNQEIVKMAKASPSHQKESFLIYYWTGACHSTPLHSHLHAPPIRFETWSLDCSPDCRSNPHAQCEVDRFANDPTAFVLQALCQREEKEEQVCELAEDEESQVCRNVVTITNECPHARLTPDFVVTRSSYERQIRSHLELAGLKEVARFTESVKGLRILDTTLGDAFHDTRFRHVHSAILLDPMIGVSLQAFVKPYLKNLQRLTGMNSIDSLARLVERIESSVEISLDEMILFSKI